MPLAAGENHYTRFDFARLLEDRAVTIFQPDLSKTGGITEALRIAAMASAFGIAVHPHSSATGINHAASLHFLAAIDNGGYFEACVSKFNPLRDMFGRTFEIGDDGCVEPLDRPGIGLDSRREGVRRIPADRRPRLRRRLSDCSSSTDCLETNRAKTLAHQVHLRRTGNRRSPQPRSRNRPSYPDKPIKIIVPYTPGGFNDTLARTVGAKLQAAWGQPVVVDNRPGGATVIGIDAAAKSPPDGYTLVVTPFSFAVNQSIFKKLPYDPVKDFAPITLAASTANLLVVSPSLPVNSVKELIALARSRSRAR